MLEPLSIAGALLIFSGLVFIAAAIILAAFIRRQSKSLHAPPAYRQMPADDPAEIAAILAEIEDIKDTLAELKDDGISEEWEPPVDRKTAMEN